MKGRRPRREAEAHEGILEAEDEEEDGRSAQRRRQTDQSPLQGPGQCERSKVTTECH